MFCFMKIISLKIFAVSENSSLKKTEELKSSLGMVYSFQKRKMTINIAFSNSNMAFCSHLTWNMKEKIVHYLEPEQKTLIINE